MKLSSPDGVEFQLTVLGYQFPEIDNQPYDSNWLMIQVDVLHPLGAWSVIDPLMLTEEGQELADWFEKTPTQQHQYDPFSFLEPGLKFTILEAVGDNIVVRVGFWTGFLPEWAPRQPYQEISIDFTSSSKILSEVAEALRVQLSYYPQRTKK